MRQPINSVAGRSHTSTISCARLTQYIAPPCNMFFTYQILSSSVGIQKDSCAYKRDTKYKRPKQVPTAKLRNSRYTALSTASVVSLKGVSASTPTSEMAPGLIE